MQRITVWGGGSWGTALAHVLGSAGYGVDLLMRDQEQIAELNSKHVNSKYLANQVLSKNIQASSDLSLLESCAYLVLAIPCQSLRQELHKNLEHLAKNKNLVLIQAAKGIELSSLKTMEMLVSEELQNINYDYSVLSGPSFALEVVQNKPSAVVLATNQNKLGEELRSIFATPYFRSYSSLDIRGVELGGALKNIIAIACGLSDGLNFGHNARAALMTRGLAEISRLGVALGARQSTFMGLSGMGDLFLTCSGDLSRNRQVGIKLAQGQKLEEIIQAMQMVAEGVKTTEAVYALSQKMDIEMPITSTVYAIIKGQLAIIDGVKALMQRSTKAEQA